MPRGRVDLVCARRQNRAGHAILAQHRRLPDGLGRVEAGYGGLQAAVLVVERVEGVDLIGPARRAVRDTG